MKVIINKKKYKFLVKKLRYMSYNASNVVSMCNCINTIFLSLNKHII